MEIWNDFFSGKVNTNIEGALDGIAVRRNITGWGETFNIEFDMLPNEWVHVDGCWSIVHFEHLGRQETYPPGVYYCGDETEAGLAFELVKGITSRHIKKDYPIKELHKLYHIQLRQSHLDGKLRRVMKIDGTIVEDYEIDDVPVYGEVEFRVYDTNHDVGIKIYNLKVTE